MKYKYNGQWVDINIKALDSMPVGTIVDYDGQSSDIPTGWEVVNNDIGEVVWVNTLGNPFPSTTANVSFGDYKSFKVYYFLDNHRTDLKTATVNNGDTLNISESGGNLTRQIDISSSTLYIHSGYYQGGQNNDAIIPSHIIGYK